MKWIKAMALSAVVTLFAAMLLLSAAGFVICRSGALPRSSLSLITTLIACAAVFLGGLLPGLSLREMAGALFLVCAGLVTVLVFQAEPDPASAGKAAAVLLSGAIGGILGANRKRKVKF